MRIKSILANGASILPTTEAYADGYRWIVRSVSTNGAGQLKVAVNRGDNVMASLPDAQDEAERQAELLARALTSDGGDE